MGRIGASLGWLGRAICTAPRAPRLGDWVYIQNRAQLGYRTRDATSFSDIWFPNAPFNGAAKVTEIAKGTLIVQFWGETYPVERVPRALRPLRRWASFLCRRRLGEWLFQREMGQAVAPRRRPHSRPDLPLVNALGGIYRSWPGFWARQVGKVLLYPLARLHVGRPWKGTGIQLRQCSAEMQFTYRGKARAFRLETLRLHSNGNYLCLGHILPSGEARTFKLADMTDLHVSGFGAIDPYHLRIELWALTMTRYAYAQKCSEHRAYAGLPAPPVPSRWDKTVGRAVEGFAALHGWVQRKWGPIHLMQLKWQGGFYPPLRGMLRRVWPINTWRYFRYRVGEYIDWRRAEWRGYSSPKVDLRRQDARWRRRLRVFASLLEKGQSTDPKALRNCVVICKDTLFARAMLRGILAQVATGLGAGSPYQRDIARCLALSPETRNYLTHREFDAAHALWDDLSEDYPITMGYQWNSIRKQTGNPIGRIIIAFIYAHYFVDYRGFYRLTSRELQDVSTTDFLVVLFFFAANWQGDSGAFDASCAARLRWLADFDMAK